MSLAPRHRVDLESAEREIVGCNSPRQDHGPNPFVEQRLGNEAMLDRGLRGAKHPRGERIVDKLQLTLPPRLYGDEPWRRFSARFAAMMLSPESVAAMLSPESVAAF